MTPSGESDSPRLVIKVPDGMNFSVGNLIRKAAIWGDRWSATVEIQAESPAAMERALEMLTQALVDKSDNP